MHNNPLRYIDPTGHYCVSVDGNWAHAGNCNTVGSIYMGDDADFVDAPYIVDGYYEGTVNADGSHTRDHYNYQMNYWKAKAMEEFRDETFAGIIRNAHMTGDTVATLNSEFYQQAVAGGVASAIASRSKPVNLPSYKKVQIDMEHIISGHTVGGSRAKQSGGKTIFPSNMSDSQIEKTVRDAYKNGKKVQTQGDRVLVRGEANGVKVEMWVNTKTNTIETAYPIN